MNRDIAQKIMDDIVLSEEFEKEASINRQAIQLKDARKFYEAKALLEQNLNSKYEIIARIANKNYEEIIKKLLGYNFFLDSNSVQLKAKIADYLLSARYYKLYKYFRKDAICSTEDDIIRKKIWAYKDGFDKDIISEFTHNLFELIAQIIQKHFLDSKQVFLLSIPSSTVGKINTIQKSITAMVNWEKQGYLKEKYNCSAELLDYGNAIIRTESIESEKSGIRSFERQVSTMKLNMDIPTDSKIILLDDIRTTGNIIQACWHILNKNGISSKNIQNCVIAQTVFEQSNKSVEDNL